MICHHPGVEKLGVEDFQAGKFWKGELYIDNGKKALKALDVKQVSIFTALKDIALNRDVSTAFKKTKEVPHNYKGDGRSVSLFMKEPQCLLIIVYRCSTPQPAMEIVE